MILEKEKYKAGLTGILILISLLALAMQAIGFNKRLVIDHTTNLEYYALDDRNMGGGSVASVSIVDNKFRLGCQIDESAYGWPFCSLTFRLTDGKSGVDLSDYSHVKLWVKYEKPSDHGIRFQARQLDPDYSSAEDESSLKYNTIEFYGKDASYPLTVSFDRFQVPSWWLVWKGLSYEDGVTDFSNIYRLEVVTGHVISPGEHNIIIERIELVGDLISAQDLYLGFLLVWILIGIIYLINKFRQMSSLTQEDDPTES
jgi:hypothetical protein